MTSNNFVFSCVVVDAKNMVMARLICQMMVF